MSQGEEQSGPWSLGGPGLMTHEMRSWDAAVRLCVYRVWVSRRDYPAYKLEQGDHFNEPASNFTLLFPFFLPYFILLVIDIYVRRLVIALFSRSWSEHVIFHVTFVCYDLTA
jgi:hypothetical protein